MIIKINPKKPEKKIINQAVEILKKGGLVAFPTDTLYAVGASALNPKAVRRVFEVRKRPSSQPLIVGIYYIRQLNLITKRIPETFKRLKKFWPGPLTMIFEKSDLIPDIVTGGAKKIAIRIPDCPIALELIKGAGPLVIPSANISKEPAPKTADEISKELAEEVDLILDGGKTKYGIESTIIDITVSPPRILRIGAISPDRVKKVLTT